MSSRTHNRRTNHTTRTRTRTQSRHLRQLLIDIFDAAFDPDICGFATINDLAVHAGLKWETVDRLYSRVTTEPHYNSIRKLARAVGMDLQLMQEEIAAHVTTREVRS